MSTSSSGSRRLSVGIALVLSALGCDTQQGQQGPQGPAGTWQGTGASLVAEIDAAVRDEGARFAQIPITGDAREAIGGLVTTVASSTQVNGIGTSFSSELQAGDALRIGSSVYAVVAVADASHLEITPAAIESLTGVAAFRDRPLLLVANAAGTPKVTIDRSGRVGIATSSPRYTLDVDGPVRQDGTTIFRKHGNNGSVSCDAFCRGAAWGRPGSCVAAQDATSGAYVGCAETTGGTGLRCACLAFDEVP